jgi:hypothetical protein
MGARGARSPWEQGHRLRARAGAIFQRGLDHRHQLAARRKRPKIARAKPGGFHRAVQRGIACDRHHQRAPQQRGMVAQRGKPIGIRQPQIQQQRAERAFVLDAGRRGSAALSAITGS